MAEYIAIDRQTVASGLNVIFDDTAVPCTKGWVIHREGSGIFTLRGITEQCRARYRVTFGANLGLPAGGTAGTISTAITLNGEPLQESVITTTLDLAADIRNVERTIIIDVPKGCCANVSVRNINAQSIDVINAVLIIDRIA